MTGVGGARRIERSSLRSLHAAAMSVAAVVYLGVLAAVVQWWNSTRILDHDAEFTMHLMAALWLPFIVEASLGLLLNPGLPGNVRRFFLVALLPPFRVGYSTFDRDRLIWLPHLGWRRKTEALFEHLARIAMVPMLVIALMILPLLGIEFLLKEQVAEWPWLSLSLDVSAAFIWFAFAIEFVVMVSVAEDKFAYCKKHWLNILIIILPLIAFLRGFQVVRTFRAARAAKLLRVYRMRGLLIRVTQALVALSAIERLIHRDPEKHLKKLEKLEREKERELALLREKMNEVRERAAAVRAAGDAAPDA